MGLRYVAICVIFVWLVSNVHTLPRVGLYNNNPNSRASNVQVHFNNRNTGAARSGALAISEETYIDYDPFTQQNSQNQLNVCTDCVCGVSNRKMRIVGGNVTEVHEFPWIASLSLRGKFICAGSLITRRHILTAAHCLEGFNTKAMQIALGDHDRSIRDSSVVNRRIKSIHMHENYDTYSFNNDIAIIELDVPVNFNEIVRPACLPENRDIDYTGAMAVAAGWGRTQEGDPESDVLRKVNLPILSTEECRTAGYDKKRVTENMFCAGYLDGRYDACKGDSGGPLHINGAFNHLEVIGIISWGRGCARPQFPGIYTRVTNYLGWLRDHLDGECVCPPPTSLNARRH